MRKPHAHVEQINENFTQAAAETAQNCLQSKFHRCRSRTDKPRECRENGKEEKEEKDDKKDRKEEQRKRREAFFKNIAVKADMWKLGSHPVWPFETLNDVIDLLGHFLYDDIVLIPKSSCPHLQPRHAQTSRLRKIDANRR